MRKFFGQKERASSLSRFIEGRFLNASKKKEKFMEMVGKLKIHENNIVFKINFFKLIEKHSKLMKSSVTLTFLKNYFKDIKQISKENSSEIE